MKKILIMTGSYFPKPMANGICTHQIALALKKNGYDVHVICFNKKGDSKEDIYEGINIHRVKMRLFFRLRFYGEDNISTWKGKLSYKVAMLINKTKKLFFIPFYPMTSPIFIYRYYKIAKAIHSKYNFDMILSAYNPLEALISGAMMKKKYKTIKFGLYVLDTLTNGEKIKYFSKSWLDNKGWKWEQRIYAHADVIYNMKCHEEHHKQKRYDQYRDKMKFVDIPLFRYLNKKSNSFENPLDNQHLHWVYTGSLSMNYYDPWYACEIFRLLQNKNNKYKFHFYSRGNCEEKLIEYETKSKDAIVRHGFVNTDEAISVISNADVLVSVGTANSSMIPSKIFEYMATGNPIIHFYKQDNDVCIPYYEKYPLALLIKQDQELLNYNAEKVVSFIENTKNKRVTFSDVKDKFIMNTPEYTASLVSSILD